MLPGQGWQLLEYGLWVWIRCPLPGRVLPMSVLPECEP